MDHLEKGTLDLSELRFVVLDEADEMLNMGFAEDVETDPGRHAGGQAGRAVLRHDARRRSGGSSSSTHRTPTEINGQVQADDAPPT